jgi:hypothetical protein
MSVAFSFLRCEADRNARGVWLVSWLSRQHRQTHAVSSARGTQCLCRPPRVPIALIHHGCIRIFHRRPGGVDLMCAALVRESILFRAEALLANWTNQIRVGHVSLPEME